MKTNQWATIKKLIGTNITTSMTWMPEDDRDRVASYLKYDEMYWNDPTQFALRVLDGESPVYIPNARTIVDTTAHYLLKGLELTCTDNRTKEVLAEFLKREAFYSRFNEAKVAGVARGDFVYHMTADPSKPKGRRISLTPVEPMNVFPIWDEEDPTRMVGCHLATTYELPVEDDPEQQTRLRRLTYRVVVQENGSKRISREEAIYKIEGGFLEKKAKKIKQIIPLGLLDPAIDTIPVYWFPNKQWLGEMFGSSELRGIERLAEVVSQAATDVAGALSLEGLGVYATDGGRPVDDNNADSEWEVAPGKVMEVPSGAYFRRVEGVGTITPAIDQIKYLESKMLDAAGLSDVAMGKVDAQIAQSGIALAIRFLPTLAKIETRDQSGKDILTQMFFNWKTWHGVFEQELLEGDIVPSIGDKLPIDATTKVNELNNMIDRGIISNKFYRSEMEKLGYKFPTDIEDQIDKEAEKKVEQARAAFLATKDTSGDDETSTNGSTLPSSGNGSNNKSRPNESKGTEATQKTRDA